MCSRISGGDIAPRLRVFYVFIFLITAPPHEQYPPVQYVAMRYLLLGLINLICVFSLNLAQDTTTLQPGVLITGRIDDSTPRDVYVLDGLRGEVLQFQLTATSEDLDPVLSIFDGEGQLIFSRDDTQGSRDVTATLTVEATAQYTIVITRFGQSLGTTTGNYDLSVERIGVRSNEGTTLQYGIPVINTISNLQPQVYYTFRANTGDIINIEMVRSSGTLDPYVQIVNRDRFLVAENDDIPDEASRNSRIENLIIDEAGTYVVIATRYGGEAGDTVGSFVLLVQEAGNSGLGNSRQVPVTLLMNQTVEGELSDTQYQRFYQFQARRDQLVTINMERAAAPGQLDTYLILATSGLQTLVEDDDGGVEQNSRIRRFRIPADGIYTIIATRFEGEIGTTTGRYRLQLTDDGDAFEGVDESTPRLLYGTTVQDSITTDDTDSLYAFWGAEGETISIAMNRADGTLNSVIELLDADQVRLIRDDDSGSGINARINRYTLPYTGVYYIRATRYEGNALPADTTGAFNLILSLITN